MGLIGFVCGLDQPGLQSSASHKHSEETVPEIFDDPIVRIPGVLRAPGIVAGCLVETWKERAFNGEVHTRCRIADDPPQLPDGPYTLRFGRHAVPTNKFEGNWEPVVLAPESQVRKAA